MRKKIKQDIIYNEAQKYIIESINSKIIEFINYNKINELHLFWKEIAHEINNNLLNEICTIDLNKKKLTNKEIIKLSQYLNFKNLNIDNFNRDELIELMNKYLNRKNVSIELFDKIFGEDIINKYKVKQEEIKKIFKNVDLNKIKILNKLYLIEKINPNILPNELFEELFIVMLDKNNKLDIIRHKEVFTLLNNREDKNIEKINSEIFINFIEDIINYIDLNDKNTILNIKTLSEINNECKNEFKNFVNKKSKFKKFNTLTIIYNNEEMKKIMPNTIRKSITKI